MIVTSDEGKTFNLETSWDDGRREDRDVAEMLLHYKLPGTFYIPGVQRELMDHQVKFIATAFDIGAHTVSHAILTDKHYEQAALWTEISESKMMMENIIHRPVKSFCYPRGRYNDRVVGLVQQAGFYEARTTEVLVTKQPVDRFRKGTSIHVYQRAEYGKTPWEKIAKKLFDRVCSADTDDDYFHLWGHGYEVIRDLNWKKLDRFLLYMRDRLR